MGRKSRTRKRNRAAKKTTPKQKTLRVTYPSGRTERIPDDGRHLPNGTMVSWDEDVRGKPEMRWTVIGGGWPFDD